MRSVLVTGAYGLLGSWLTKALLDGGARVTVLRRDDAPASALTLEGDVRGSGTPTGEIDRQWVDPSRLRALTGWEPRVDLADGIERTVAFYREHLSRYL